MLTRAGKSWWEAREGKLRRGYHIEKSTSGVGQSLPFGIGGVLVSIGATKEKRLSCQIGSRL